MIINMIGAWRKNRKRLDGVLISVDWISYDSYEMNLSGGGISVAQIKKL